MSGCHFCGRSSHPFEVFSDRLRLCKPCTFRVTVLEENLVEVIELMEGLFESCPEPERLSRQFDFYGKYLGLLFDGIASEKTKRNLFSLLTGSYGTAPVSVGTDAFFADPSHLREVREGIRRDRYLRKLFNDRGFVFSREGELETDAFSSRPPASSQGGASGTWGNSSFSTNWRRSPSGKPTTTRGSPDQSL